MAASRLFTGGRILTMVGTGETDAVLIEGDRIVATGDRARAGSTARPDLETIDLAGRTLVPGFIDAHNHLSIAALHPVWADLAGASSVEELAAALSTQAAAEPEAEWVRGAGWNDFGTGFVPHRRDLDALDLGRPILVAHTTLHQGVTDSRGLELLGIGRTTPDPPGGEIGRDRDGEPNGLLVERAWGRAHAASLAAYADGDRWPDLILQRARVLVADGITAVHDAACAPSAEAVYAALARAGRLPLSVLAMPHPEALLDQLDPGRLEGPVTGEGDEWFRIGPVKLFADGGIAPAIDAHMGGAPVQFGMLTPDLNEGVLAAAQRGFRVAVHAIGNAGVQAAIEAFAAASRAVRRDDQRFRIEHAALATPSQAADLAALGAVAVVQPGFVRHFHEQTGGAAFDEAAWLPFADLAAASVPLAASSDDPCALHQPLTAISLGATRRTHLGALAPEQSVPFGDWLRAYTAGAAFAGGQEHERGSIVPGLRADFVVLEGPLDPSSPPRVAQTWIAGNLVHDVNLCSSTRSSGAGR